MNNLGSQYGVHALACPHPRSTPSHSDLLPRGPHVGGHSAFRIGTVALSVGKSATSATFLYHARSGRPFNQFSLCLCVSVVRFSPSSPALGGIRPGAPCASVVRFAPYSSISCPSG